MTRPTLEAMLLGIATTVATRSTCSRLQVGAVIAREGRVLSTGYNGSPSNLTHCQHDDDSPCAVSVHAEANAVAFAARHGAHVDGAHLYLTHAPCVGCSGLIINTGLVGVVYLEPYRDPAGVNRLRAAGLDVRTH